MNETEKKLKKAAKPDGEQFSNSESFGLFMEGLRALKKYTEESEKVQPDHAVLEQRLEDALESLGKCEISYPKDLLSLYSLGLALTTKNQNLYAQMLMKHGAESPRLTRLSPRRALTPIVLARTQGASGADAPPGKKPKRKGRKKYEITGVFFMEAEYLPRPPSRAWPHLNHAIELFEEILEKGPPEMQTAAIFNLAHLYSKRDEPGPIERDESGNLKRNESRDLELAEALLQSIEEHSSTRKWSLLSRFRGKEADMAAEDREAQVDPAIWLQSRTLLASVTARKDLRKMSHEKKEFDPGSAAVALSQARELIDKAKELPATKKTELEADCWTKAGYLAYEQAFALSPDDIEFEAYLGEAENFLRRALVLKENWNPAQIYLAQVLQAQGHVEEAQQFLEAVLGKQPAPATAPSPPPPSAQAGAPQAQPQTPAAPSEPQQPKK